MESDPCLESAPGAELAHMVNLTEECARQCTFIQFFSNHENMTYFEHHNKKYQVILLIVIGSSDVQYHQCSRFQHWSDSSDSNENELEPESSLSEVKKEPKSDSVADSRPGIITALQDMHGQREDTLTFSP